MDRSQRRGMSGFVVALACAATLALACGGGGGGGSASGGADGGPGGTGGGGADGGGAPGSGATGSGGATTNCPGYLTTGVTLQVTTWPDVYTLYNGPIYGVCVKAGLHGPNGEKNLLSPVWVPLSGVTTFNNQTNYTFAADFDLENRDASGALALMEPGEWRWFVYAEGDCTVPDKGEDVSIAFFAPPAIDCLSFAHGGPPWSHIACGSFTAACGKTPVSVNGKIGWTKQ